jgi:Fe2+ or Zn2+ uptake regulation protein
MCQGSAMKRPPLTEIEIAQARRQLRQTLRKHGYSATARRREIYDVMLQANDHICAEHILNAVEVVHPTWRVNKTTIYRTLDLFQSLGLVTEMRHADGRAQYELAMHRPHGHLLCRMCGEVQDLDMVSLSAIYEELERKQGFRVELGDQALPGVCARCARSAR